MKNLTFQYDGFTVRESPGIVAPSSPVQGVDDSSRFRLVTEGYSTWLPNGAPAPQGRSGGEAAVPAERKYVGISATLYANGEAVAVNRYDTNTFAGGTVYLGKDALGSVRGATNDYGLLEDRYEYDAFGKPYKGDLNNGMNLGYTGKPYDTATGMYNYGYRDYQPEVARFTTVDPIRDGNNWFAYVNNDPVNWVDLWGLEAGEIFPTMDAAAIDFGKEWNGISIDEGVEYGSTIYRSGEGYTYAEPRTDNNPHEVNFALPPGGADEATAGLHTHGNYLNDTDNYFSEYDIDKAKEYGKPSYISTPNGSLIVYDPITDTPRVVTRDLPSDPNDPSSKNYKGSTPGKGK